MCSVKMPTKFPVRLSLHFQQPLCVSPGCLLGSGAHIQLHFLWCAVLCPQHVSPTSSAPELSSSSALGSWGFAWDPAVLGYEAGNCGKWELLQVCSFRDSCWYQMSSHDHAGAANQSLTCFWSCRWFCFVQLEERSYTFWTELVGCQVRAQKN